MSRDWKQMGFAAVLALFTAVVLAPDAAAAAKGKKVFNKCKACHSLKAGKNKVGPHLAGIFGREAGAVEGFKYSKAMKAWGGTWTEDNLDKYLTKPKKFIKGNRMAFPGLKKAEQRAAVIEYMKSGGK